ncbi:hypothetical protein B484DRAFT_47015 [Ochromonadaceae sp. CCMP2298]|nr:hypothetical protein B484DRAFT_47015 [Ochromonadaceae sp. CCMP2298]
MGGSASIKIQHSIESFKSINDAHFQELLSSRAAREQLFEEISNYTADKENRIEVKGKISLKKLAAYFTNNENALYPGFLVNVDVLNEAFTYTIQRKNMKILSKAKKAKAVAARKSCRKELHLTKRSFHRFLPTLLLFVRIWGVFDAADKLVVEDQKVFRGEFAKIKENLNNLHGISIFGDINAEDWDREFTKLDVNNDGYVTFYETTAYVIKNIERPFDYIPGEDESDSDEDEESDPNAFIEVRAIQADKVEAEVELAEALAAVSAAAAVAVAEVAAAAAAGVAAVAAAAAAAAAAGVVGVAGVSEVAVPAVPAGAGVAGAVEGTVVVEAATGSARSLVRNVLRSFRRTATYFALPLPRTESIPPRPGALPLPRTESIPESEFTTTLDL